MSPPVEVGIDKLVHRGLGLARLPDGRAVFVAGTIPGERVRIRVTRTLARHAFADLEEVIEAAPSRRRPPCPLFGRCGGCQLMHLPHPEQIRHKQAILADIWRNQAPLAPPQGAEGPELGYRHRVRLHVRDGRAGFMHPNTNSLVEVSDCPVCVPALRQAIPWVGGELAPRLQRLGLPAATVHLIAGSLPPAAIGVEAATPWRPSAVREVARDAPYPMAVLGRDPIRRQLDLPPHQFLIETGVFFQANPSTAVSVTRHPAARPVPDQPVLELYCGMGLFTADLARSAAQVEAVEGDPRAANLFRLNMRRNGIANARLHARSVEAWLADRPDPLNAWPSLFLDPPRTGVGRQTRARLARATADRLIYLACEPTTQHRDVSTWLATDRWRLTQLVLFDFFPNTYHIECLALLHGVP